MKPEYRVTYTEGGLPEIVAHLARQNDLPDWKLHTHAIATCAGTLGHYFTWRKVEPEPEPYSPYCQYVFTESDAGIEGEPCLSHRHDRHEGYYDHEFVSAQES